MSRPTTPPPMVQGEKERAPLTPEVKRRIETNRLKAKAIREAHLAAAASSTASPKTITTRTTAPQKRTYAQLSSVRASTNASPPPPTSKPALQPARKFQRSDFIEFDFSRITDTKGGFLSTTDDPHSLLSASDLASKPPGMSLADWSAHQLRLQLQKDKKGPFEPALSALKDADTKCRECDSPEVDWDWVSVFRCAVCNRCKDAHAERYTLLTKTEAREDYLLTDPELRDAELLPHMKRRNPRKSTWNDMMLYLRYQVEEFAVRKWGGLEELDKEFERRTGERKRRREVGFRKRLGELKRRTRVESWRKGAGGGKHVHVWGTAVTGEGGMEVRTCEECGLEVEEMVF